MSGRKQAMPTSAPPPRASIYGWSSYGRKRESSSEMTTTGRSPMRTIAIALGLATALAALLAAPATARPALTHQVNVTVTDGGCTLQYNSVSRRNTTILFHVINNGTVAHGF